MLARSPTAHRTIVNSSRTVHHLLLLGVEHCLEPKTMLLHHINGSYDAKNTATLLRGSVCDGFDSSDESVAFREAAQVLWSGCQDISCTPSCHQSWAISTLLKTPSCQPNLLLAVSVVKYAHWQLCITLSLLLIDERASVQHNPAISMALYLRERSSPLIQHLLVCRLFQPADHARSSHQYHAATGLCASTARHPTLRRVCSARYAAVAMGLCQVTDRHSTYLIMLLIQDFGARDPTPGEIGSNFGEKIVMNWDTEHIIK